jgi:hypothetical protein
MDDEVPIVFGGRDSVEVEATELDVAQHGVGQKPRPSRSQRQRWLTPVPSPIRPAFRPP